MDYCGVLCSRRCVLSRVFVSPFASPLRQLTVPLCVPPGGLEAELSQLRSPLHPFTLQTPHVGGEDAAQTKVLQALLVRWGERRSEALKKLHYTSLMWQICSVSLSLWFHSLVYSDEAATLMQLSLFYLHNSHLSSDLRQSRVKVV